MQDKTRYGIYMDSSIDLGEPSWTSYKLIDFNAFLISRGFKLAARSTDLPRWTYVYTRGDQRIVFRADHCYFHAELGSQPAIYFPYQAIPTDQVEGDRFLNELSRLTKTKGIRDVFVGPGFRFFKAKRSAFSNVSVRDLMTGEIIKPRDPSTLRPETRERINRLFSTMGIEVDLEKDRILTEKASRDVVRTVIHKITTNYQMIDHYLANLRVDCGLTLQRAEPVNFQRARRATVDWSEVVTMPGGTKFQDRLCYFCSLIFNSGRLSYWQDADRSKDTCGSRCSDCEPPCVCFLKPNHEGNCDWACQYREESHV